MWLKEMVYFFRDVLTVAQLVTSILTVLILTRLWYGF